MAIETDNFEPTDGSSAMVPKGGTAKRSPSTKQKIARKKTLEDLIRETPENSVDRAWQNIREVGREVL